MPDQILSAIAHCLVGGIAANVLLIMGLVNVAVGGEGSKIRKDRRLAIDSDAKVFGIFFLVGAFVGCGVAVSTGLTTEWALLVITAIVGFFSTTVVGLVLTSKINDVYIRRARQNLKDGLYTEAIEDAAEVARSSQRLRYEARAIKKLARELRDSEPLEIPVSSNTPEEQPMEQPAEQPEQAAEYA